MKATLRRFVALAAIGWLGGCLDDSVGPCLTCPPTLAPLVASNPVPATAARIGGTPPQSVRAVTGDVVYVSLAPGTLPAGGLARIRNRRTADAVPVAMANGGFDPVSIEAAAGDTLDVDVQVDGGGFAPSMMLVVAGARRPVVVRTEPPPRKRDVPLNASMFIVFSEPISRASLAGIRLLHGSAPVSGTTVLSGDGLRAEFRPTQPLASNTDYVLSVSTGVTDASGEPLEQSVDAAFSTGTTVATAMVFTTQVAMFINPNTGTPRTLVMNAVRDSSGRVTGEYTIFYPEGGRRITGRVLCFAIVGANAAWLGGVIDSATDPAAVGGEHGWRVVDNGSPGGGVSDQLSLAFPLGPGGVPSALEWCATTPVFDPWYGDVALHELVSGDVVARGYAPPPPPPPEEPLPPPPGAGMSQIAFVTPGGVTTLVMADGYGVTTRSLTPGYNPAWSADATTLAVQGAWQGSSHIYSIRWDGSGRTQLTTGSGVNQAPAWSPDASRIAFVRDSSVHVMNVDGTGVTRLSFGGLDSHPSWSPDGTRIVFASSRSGVTAIHVMNADGSDVVQVTDDSAGDYNPSWSPDGNTIAFQRGLETRGLGANRVGSIYVMNPDGTGLTRVVAGNTPSWSPDGSRILYELFGITSVRLDGSAMSRIGGIAGGYAPAWSPVGTMPPEPTPFRSVEMLSGDGQTGTVYGPPLALPLRVRVLRDDGTPEAGARIRWDTWGAGAALSAAVSVTDAAGIATVVLTPGDTPGPLYVRAALPDGTARVGEVVFTATLAP